jgi:RNA polymerase sigma factor (sigma-70 family)
MSIEQRKPQRARDEGSLYRLQQDTLMPEHVLIERLKANEPEAWEYLHRLYTPELRKAIRRSLNKRHIPLDRADDIEQTVWKNVQEQIGDFVYQGQGKLYHWFVKIAYYCVCGLMNVEQSNDLSLEELAERQTENPLVEDNFFYKNRMYVESAEDSAEVELRRAELRKILQPILERALRELSARDREIVVRYFIMKEKPGALAERFDLKIANIYQIVYRAKKTMRTYLVARGLFGPDQL